MSKYTQFGYTWEREIKQSLDYLSNKTELFYTKYVDTNSYNWGKIWCSHCHQKFNNPFIVPKALCDYIVITHKNTIFLECKSTKNSTSFPLENIEPHQWKFGIQIGYYGKPYNFIICNRSEKRNFSAYSISAIELDEMRAESPRKSVKWEELEKRALKIPQIKGGIWNLEGVIT